tara:strand:+ start:1760 stop:2503 length:744 start_codon:yes stop_codon:yes gene_type:complete
MSENFFQINKKDVVSKFKTYVKQHSDPTDDYNPHSAKPVANHRNYNTLDRIRALYHWVISESKLELRRKYIHNDKEFKEIIGKLESYTRNKIKSQKDGTMYLKVNNQLTFTGDQKTYRDNFVQNSVKQLSMIRKIVDELNGVLAGEEIEDPNKPILNDTSLKGVYKEYTSEEVAEVILKQVSDDYLLEISEQNFDNFNNRVYVLLDQYKVSAADTKDILLKIQESFTPEEENDESETDHTKSEDTEL